MSTTKPGGIPIFARSAPSGEPASFVRTTVYADEVDGLMCEGVAPAVNVLTVSAEAPEATSRHAAATAAGNRLRRSSMDPP